MAAVTRPLIGAPSLRQIVETASRITSINVGLLTGKHKWKELVAVRSAIAQIGRRYGYSTTQIGEALSRDHTTISHAMANRRPNAMAILSALDKTLSNEFTIVDEDVVAPSKDALTERRKRGIGRGTLKQRPRVAPFPPGADRMLQRGVPRKTLNKMWPEWRI